MARERIGKQLRHAWNAFVADRQSTSLRNSSNVSPWYGPSMGRPDTNRMRHVNDKTLLTAIYVRMAVDAAGVEFRHVRLDDDEQYKETIRSGLNECLSVEANIDQASAAFFLDVYMSLFDEGYIAIVPVDTTLDPDMTGGWDVTNMRVGMIRQFYPQHVCVSVLDENIGDRRDLILEKKFVAVVYNPFYSVMNDGSSVLQRLTRKLSILDVVDEASANGKLDVLVQLPYTVRGPTRKKQAEDRTKDLQDQLKNSPLGIGYIDATDKVIQLNRPAENSLMTQIEYLVNLLYTQLGLTPEIMNGSAEESAMLNYMHRTISPLNRAVKQAMVRSFLTKTARTQGQSIMTFWDPFNFLPLSQIADIADKLIRNEVLTANEIRPKLGYKPSTDPNANKLGNPNMPGNTAADLDSNGQPTNVPGKFGSDAPEGDLFEEMNKVLDDAFKDLGVDENAL